MKTFQEWLDIREGSQGLKARERRAVGLAKRAERLRAYKGLRSDAAAQLAQDVENATRASNDADRRMFKRERDRRELIIAGGKEGRVMARATSDERLRNNRMRSRDASIGMYHSFLRNNDGSYGSSVTPADIKTQLASRKV